MIENLKTKREYHKNRLTAYVLNHQNNFDRAVDEVIKELKEKIEKEYEDHNQWIDFQQEDEEKFNETEEIANRTGHSIYNQMKDYIETAVNMEDELTALLEMKIIYAFKHLEINLKSFISFAFNDNTVSKTYKWNNLIEYLKIKKIDIKSLSGYAEVNQLKDVNNSLKHSSSNNDESLKYIPEFSNKNLQKIESLELFYERIEPDVSLFLTSLLEKTIETLYNFDEEKLKDIADNITLSMDKDKANELMKLIENNYK
jgi:hypothetical protein